MRGGGGGGGGGGGVIGSRFCDSECERELTVRKTSLFSPGDGFLVYEQQKNHHHQEEEGVGEMVFRVETYGGQHHHNHRDELVLMGPEGSCILTIKKKRASLHQRWEGFLGDEDGEDGTSISSTKKPLFSVRRSSIIGRFGTSSSFLVDLYAHGNGNGSDMESGEDQESPPALQYLVEGSFSQRCCMVYENNNGGVDGGGRRVAVEIGRKVDASTNVVVGKDVFRLRLSPGFDAAFAMGIVLALDQITADDPLSPLDGPTLSPSSPSPLGGGGRH